MAVADIARGSARIAACLLLGWASWLTVWWRPDPPVPEYGRSVITHPLDFAPRAVGPFTLTGAWRLGTGRPGFDSLSALTIENGEFHAIGDRAHWYRFPKPGDTGPTRSGGVMIAGFSSTPTGDAEAVVSVPETGRTWLAMENIRAIVRYEADGSNRFVRPSLMAGWEVNAGPEAMVRLADGRFVVLAEGLSEGSAPMHRAVIFAGDPVDFPDGAPFHFVMPGGVSPVEAALLPDGRVLILGRDLRLPFRFVTTLAIADPALIRPGQVWRAKEIARLDAPGLADNYEGMAVEPRPEGGISVWLVSDDNQARFLQRTLLLRLDSRGGVFKPDDPELRPAHENGRPRA